MAVFYAIIMALAFVAVVILSTILIVTKKKEEQEERYPFREFDEEEAARPALDRRDKGKAARSEFDVDFEEYDVQGMNPDREDFGYVETNPICTTSPAATERYLAELRTERGEGLRWLRDGTVTVKRLNKLSNVNVELYSLYLHGTLYKKIYICPFGRNSGTAPVGLILSDDGKRLSYGGSIASEAKEKGITEEQVLEKHALVYETKREAARERNTGTGRQETKKHAAENPSSVARTREQKQTEAAPESFEKNDHDVPLLGKAEEKRVFSFPKYLPGFEPDDVKPALEKFLAVMDKAYPDGIIYYDTWDHARWDRAASMLCRYLGYAKGADFLEAYGYTVEKS